MLVGGALACAGVVAIALSAELEWAPLLVPVVWAFSSMVILGGLVAVLFGLVEVSKSRRGRRGAER
jgi:cytochrome bd-type quinol oxidase subunit 1